MPSLHVLSAAEGSAVAVHFIRSPDRQITRLICVHFESPDDLPLAAIGKLISAISSEQWIEMYEQSRLKTKAGKAQMAKQGAASASKLAAKRVATKRRR